MTLNAAGWFDWAFKAPPHVPGGTNGGRNGGKGMIPHSAVGDWDTLSDLMEFLEGRITAPEGQRASWGGTNMKNGIFYQHFSVWEQTWTSGCGYANNNFFAFENAGGAYFPNGDPNFSEPLTHLQTDNIIHIGRDLKAVQFWNPRRPINSADLDASLYEHNEMTRWGAAATACPSGRIPWNIIVPSLKEPEEDMAAIELIWAYETSQLYVLGQGDPRWVADPKAAADLEKAYGKPTKALSTAALKALGAK